MNTKYEIYQRTEGKKKTYLVSIGYNRNGLIEEAKRYFHSSKEHIICMPVWTIRGNMYLKDPKIKGTKQRWAAYLR